MIFSGVGTALVTPFYKGKIDYDSLKRLIDIQIANGVDCLVVAGTTGEAPTLNDSEHKRLIEFVTSYVGGRVKVVGGSGSNNTRHAVMMTKFCEKVGADGALIISPYYNKGNDDGIFESFYKIGCKTNLPIIVYNVPTRTGVNMSIDLYKRLSVIDNVVGIKEADNNFNKIIKMCHELKDRFDIYAGNDSLMLPTMLFGGKGVISVLSNIMPNKIVKMCKYAQKGKLKKSLEIFNHLQNMIDILSIDVNPIPIKESLHKMGLISDELRLPLCRLTVDKRLALYNTLKEYKLIKGVGF